MLTWRTPSYAVGKEATNLRPAAVYLIDEERIKGKVVFDVQVTTETGILKFPRTFRSLNAARKAVETHHENWLWEQIDSERSAQPWVLTLMSRAV